MPSLLTAAGLSSSCTEGDLNSPIHNPGKIKPFLINKEGKKTKAISSDFLAALHEVLLCHPRTLLLEYNKPQMKTVAIGEAYFNIWLIQLKKNMLKMHFLIPIYLYSG